ncbi:hypothetical protein FAZ69_18245 [Trinickia terrae]|uniref:Uncharacterized protein n=1 Tax=Trinickia terrae TaxID=2571161 RepID=A0A4U1I263_9BURK|nr:hypothetical protein [Trinickia terrae]TKC87274.1 hypothetical protein FAZ69_18245 [Trinickia terrae]
MRKTNTERDARLRRIAGLIASATFALIYPQLGIGKCVAAANDYYLKVSPDFPCDVRGGAQKASLEDAAVFAWQEFYALNWPADVDSKPF